MKDEDRENLKRLRENWFPRRGARWYWWVLADAIMLAWMLRRWVERLIRRRRLR